MGSRDTGYRGCTWTMQETVNATPNQKVLLEMSSVAGLQLKGFVELLT